MKTKQGYDHDSCILNFRHSDNKSRYVSMKNLQK